MPLNIIQCHRFLYQSKLICNFLLVTNTNLPPILHSFQDIPSAGPKLLYLEEFPWDNLRKIFRGCQRMAKVLNGVKILRKISTG